MAGPGGGRSAGGFSGGSFGTGSSGGGFAGGSFGGNNNGGSFSGGFTHGPHHHGPHPHYHRPFFGWGRRRYAGGGCSTVFILGFFILFAVLWFIGEPTESGSVITFEPNGAVYNEATMQDYANEKYNEYFGAQDTAATYEDNILLVFLANEQADGYYTIAWVGDNIRSEINSMFGEYSEYGQALSQNINDYYAYSLDTNLASAMYFMTDSVTQLGLDSSFYETRENVAFTESRIENLTSLDISTEVVNRSLYEFTKKTGIPIIIVVDSFEKIFGADTSESVSVSAQAYGEEIIGSDDGYTTVPVVKASAVTFVPVIIAVILSAVAVAVIIRNKKRGTAKGNTDSKGNETPPWEM